MWIHFLNDPKLPVPVPFLDLLFAANGILHGVMMFVPDEKFCIVIRAEAFVALVLVVIGTVPQGARDAKIDCATIAARHDVNSREFFFTHVGKPIKDFSRCKESGIPAFAGMTVGVGGRNK